MDAERLSAALREAEETHGPNHPSTAVALFNLAVVWLGAARYDDAKPLLVRAFDILVAHGAIDSSIGAAVLVSLGDVFSRQGHYGGALQLVSKAISIREAAGGAEAAGVQQLREMLQWLEPAARTAALCDEHVEQGRYADAIPLAEALRALQERLLPPGHHYRGAALNNLGSLYVKQGRFAEAEGHFTRALQITEAACGPDSSDVGAMAGNLGGLYEQLGRYDEAERLFARALAIDEAALGPGHPSLAVDLNNLAGLYQATGRYLAARPLLERALAIELAARGEEHHEVAIALDNLGSVLSELGQDGPAEEFCRRALAVFEKTSGPEHPETATCLDNLAALLQKQERLDEARVLALRALRIREQRLGGGHPDLAESFRTLGRLSQAQGDFASAIELHRQAIELIQATHGPDHPLMAAALLDRAATERTLARHQQAELSVRRAIEIRQAALRAGHPEIADAQGRLAAIYEDAGRHAEAEALYTQAVESVRASLPPRHPTVAARLSDHATLLHTLGRYVEAEQELAEVLDVQREVYGPRSPAVALTLGALAALHRSRGDVAQARALLETCLEILRGAPGDHSLAISGAVAGLGALAQMQGHYGEAERHLRQALEARQRRLGAGHPDVASRAVALAGLHYAKGDFAAAEQMYRAALDVFHRNPGPEHPSTASVLNDLGSLLMDTGELAEAERLTARALAIREHVFGARHPSVAQSANNLAEVYRLQGRYQETEPLYQRALTSFRDVLGPEHPQVARVLNNIGLVRHARGDYPGARQALQDALAIEEAALGDKHPALPQTLINLGVCHWAQGQTTEALAAFARAHEVRERGFGALLDTGSERQRTAAVRRLAGELDTVVSLHTQTMRDDPRALSLAGRAVLARKGRVLDALADTVEALRRHLSDGNRELLDRLSAVRTRLAARATAETGTSGLGWDAREASDLLREEERLQRELTERSAEYRVETEPLDLKRVQSLIPATAVLVDVLSYRAVDPRRPADAPAAAAPRYVAYVLHAEGEPGWVDLGDAAAIDRLVETFRAALADRTRDDVAAHARALDEQVMRPIRARLGDARHVLLSPDGALNLVPFAALQDERGRYLIEDYTFTYLASGRDLLRLARRPPSRGAPVVVAGVNYALRGHDPARRQWPLLPHTLGEADAITDVFPDAVVLGPDDATEAALRAVAGPRLLHVATHGYFVTEEGEGPGAANPLLRAGLLLAGANGRRVGDDDGVLSALEVSGLDLWGTRLVVLSACETGLGEVRNREGVYGLRRALVLAGAESQVISLWQVSSVATRTLMRGYYERLHAGLGRTEALHAAQRAMLAGPHSHPYDWAAFIPSGAWEPLFS